MTCCVFFAVINDAGDYPILPAYRACRDARRRVETGVSPCDAGGVGGIPPTFARTRATDSSHTSHMLLGSVSRRRCPSHTVAYLFAAMLCCGAPPRLPKNILRSPTSRVHAQQILRIPATGYSAVKPPPMPFAYCRLPIRRHAVLRYGARSLTYLMYCSLPRALRALPDNEYPALTTVIPAGGN